MSSTTPINYICNDECSRILHDNPCALKHFYQPSNYVCLIAVKISGFALLYVLNQTPEICEAAVNQDRTSIIYVKNVTDKLRLIAIRQAMYATFEEDEHRINQYNKLKRNPSSDERPEPTLHSFYSRSGFTYASSCAYRKLPDIYNGNQTDSICLDAVTKCGHDLEFVKTQTDEICRAAILQTGDALRFVKNQTEELCLLALNEDVRYIQYVKHNRCNNSPIVPKTSIIKLVSKSVHTVTPFNVNIQPVQMSGKLQQMVTTQNQHEQEYTLNGCDSTHSQLVDKWSKQYPTNEEISMVCKDGLNIKYVKHKTVDLCMKAIEQNGLALQYIKNQSYDICKCAIIEDWNALKYVKSQTRKLCLLAIMVNGHAIKHIKWQTKEVCLEAVKNDVSSLRYIKNQTHYICLTAINIDVCALQYIKHQTRELCLFAINKNTIALEYIKNQTKEYINVYNKLICNNI